MQTSSIRRGRVWRAALALGLVVGLAAPASATPATPRDDRITAAEVAAANAKVRVAYEALVVMWHDELAAVGHRFAVPGLVRYRTAAPSACGPMTGGNAAYCPADNTVYYDDLFVAAQARAAARMLGTDGDMAAIGVIAHEVGHAVAMQLGYLSRRTYENEAVADCLAGAFARRADEEGSLEPGDVEEAFFAMAAAGEPTPVLTGDARRDRRVLLRATRSSHGTREQRMENFGRGLGEGAAGCLSLFAGGR